MIQSHTWESFSLFLHFIEEKTHSKGPAPVLSTEQRLHKKVKIRIQVLKIAEFFLFLDIVSSVNKIVFERNKLVTCDP